MKFLHISDLHIGKRVNEFSMLEDQQYILTKIINIIDAEKPDAVFICGDVYDKSVPSAEAVTLFDDFLVRIVNRNIKVFIISGNHDSPERMAFGSRIMNARGVYISPVYGKEMEPIKLEDENGTINIYLLPFIKPAHIRMCFPEEVIESYADAVKIAINNMKINKDQRNILLTHQFVTGSERSESEDISVGGSDNVPASVFSDFDYIALGHIHRPQNVWRETLRYCGTPLKYSFSEARDQKSVTLIEMMEKDNIIIRTVDLIPKRDMKEIKGTYIDITSKKYYESFSLDDYYHITLTDEEDVPDAMNKLRIIYKNIMRLDYDNKRTAQSTTFSGSENVENKLPIDLLSEFYQLQNNQPLSEEQKAYAMSIMDTVR